MSKKINHNKYLTLSALTYAALADIDAGEERFSQFLKWAIDGAKKLQLAKAYSVKTVIVEMKPHKQIDFEEGMVDWVFIGFKCGDTIKAFANDRSIPRHFDKINGVPQANVEYPNILEASVDDFVPFYGYDNFSSSGGGHFYGARVPYNYRGYFDVDYDLRVINFKRVVNNINEVYMTFITDGISYDGPTIMPPQAFKVIQDYIHWQRREHDDNIPDSKADRAKRIFEDSLDEYLINKIDYSLQDIHTALTSARSQVPK